LFFSVLLFLSPLSTAAADRITAVYTSIAAAYAPFWVAKDKGIFDKYNLDARWLYMRGTVPTTAALANRDIEFVQSGAAPFNNYAARGGDVVLLGCLANKVIDYVLIAHPSISRIEQLRGKTIGISSFGSDTDLSMKMYAATGKLDPEKDIKRIVAGSTSTRLQGLKAGSLDATTLSPPFNIYAEQMGLRVLAYVGDFLEFPQSGFTVSDATLKTKRELIKKLLRGTLRSLQFTLKNRAETARFIAKDYKLQDAVAEKVYASLLPAMSENGLATDKGLKMMIETLGTAVGKNVDFPPERLIDYTLLNEVQKELAVQ